jgi:hypothetical protein
MKWYLTLTIQQRINLKELYYQITGIDFVTAGLLFTFKERIELVYQKLKIEGLI